MVLDSCFYLLSSDLYIISALLPVPALLEFVVGVMLLFSPGSVLPMLGSLSFELSFLLSRSSCLLSFIVELCFSLSVTLIISLFDSIISLRVSLFDSITSRFENALFIFPKNVCKLLGALGNVLRFQTCSRRFVTYRALTKYSTTMREEIRTNMITNVRVNSVKSACIHGTHKCDKIKKRK